MEIYVHSSIRFGAVRNNSYCFGIRWRVCEYSVDAAVQNDFILYSDTSANEDNSFRNHFR